MSTTPITPVEVSRISIDNAASFAFQGAPRSYMELDIKQGIDASFERWVYGSYGYSWKGEKSDYPLIQLTRDLIVAITYLKRTGRVAVIWRKYPELEYSVISETSYASLRLAIVDENLQQVELELPCGLIEGAEFNILSS